MRNLTLILFGLLVVLLAISSADGLNSRLYRRNFRVSLSSKKNKKTKHEDVKRKHAEELVKKEAEHKKLEQEKKLKEKEEKKKDSNGEKDLLEHTNINQKYKVYYKTSQGKEAPIRFSQHHVPKNSKGFDEAKARLVAAEVSKKPQTYLESIGGGKGGSNEIQQNLVKQKIQNGLKYH